MKFRLTSAHSVQARFEELCAKAEELGLILRVGTPLEVIGGGKAEERYSCAFITVRGQGHDFDVLAADIGRFLEV